MSQHVVEHPDTTELETEQVMEEISLEDSTAKQDMISGQPVIVTVRWILILSSLVLAIWNVGTLSDLRLQIMTILLLAITNFYLQAQLLMKKTVNRNVIFGASAVDLLMITMLVLFQGGYLSSIYVFYLPAIAAFAVAFPTPQTVIFTAATIIIYGTICLFTGDSSGAGSVIFARLIMIASIAFCGNLYLRIERNRREETHHSHEELLDGIAANTLA